jgi:hypothetical protein
MRDLCRLEERFAWYAAGPSAVSTDPVLLNKRHFGPELCGKAGCCQPSGAGAYDHQIPLPRLLECCWKMQWMLFC